MVSWFCWIRQTRQILRKLSALTRALNYGSERKTVFYEVSTTQNHNSIAHFLHYCLRGEISHGMDAA
jgi:hypothetical protein